MKKVLNIIFALMLGLSMVACDSMLKESLTAGSGWGDVILNEANVSMGSSLSVTAGALDFTKAVVTVGGKTGTTGTVIKNVQSGTKSLTISVPAKDGKKIYSGTGSVAVKANEIVTATATLNTAVAAVNSYKFILTEAKYNSTIKSGDAAGIAYADITTVSLAGGMNGWSNTSKLYSLIKQTDGSWIGYFPCTAGTEFKYIINSTWTGGSNLAVGEITDLVETAMVWQFKLTEAKYNSTIKSGDAAGIAYADITTVSLAGGMNGWSNTSKLYSLIKQTDGSWIGYFPATDGTEFKYIINSTWTGGSNLSVGEITDLVTQNF